MNPLDALDMELRTGISHEDVDAFASRMDMVLLVAVQHAQHSGG